MVSNEIMVGKLLLFLGKINFIEVFEVMKKLRLNKVIGYDLILFKII